MKTIAKIIALISIMMLPLIASAGNPAVVTYKVTIHMPQHIPFNSGNIVVAITDANNKPVDHPQLLIKGVSTYVFTEPKSVQAVRIAQLLSYGNWAPMNGVATPDVKKGTFLTGKTYGFDIWVQDPTGTVNIE